MNNKNKEAKLFKALSLIEKITRPEENGLGYANIDLIGTIIHVNEIADSIVNEGREE